MVLRKLSVLLHSAHKIILGRRARIIIALTLLCTLVFILKGRSVDTPKNIETVTGELKNFVNQSEEPKEAQEIIIKKKRMPHLADRLTSDEEARLSVLGRMVFLGEDPPPQRTRKFVILVWKHGPVVHKRLVQRYSGSDINPFGNHCSVHNCVLSYDEEQLQRADAIMFHLQKMMGPHTMPKWHNPKQRWIFLTDETPYHTFASTHDFGMADYNGLFNWSMAYTADSDIPVPYGITLKIPEEEWDKSVYEKDFSSGKRLAAVMGTHCGSRNNRWAYVNKLLEYVPVDRYGLCGNMSCPGRIDIDCPLLFHKYKFYLAFENSNCREYISEKIWKSFVYEAVPVIMGSKNKDLRRILPPNSFINVEDFEGPKDLARYLDFLNYNQTEYNKFHAWRAKYEAVSWHGYFGTLNFHYCRICEALNYNSLETQTYHDLYSYWNIHSQCYKPTWNLNK